MYWYPYYFYMSFLVAWIFPSQHQPSQHVTPFAYQHRGSEFKETYGRDVFVDASLLPDIEVKSKVRFWDGQTFIGTITWCGFLDGMVLDGQKVFHGEEFFQHSPTLEETRFQIQKTWDDMDVFIYTNRLTDVGFIIDMPKSSTSCMNLHSFPHSSFSPHLDDWLKMYRVEWRSKHLSQPIFKYIYIHNYIYIYIYIHTTLCVHLLFLYLHTYIIYIRISYMFHLFVFV